MLFEPGFQILHLLNSSEFYSEPFWDARTSPNKFMSFFDIDHYLPFSSFYTCDAVDMISGHLFVIDSFFRPVKNFWNATHPTHLLPLERTISIFFFLWPSKSTDLWTPYLQRICLYLTFYIVTLFYCILFFNNFIFIHRACKTRVRLSLVFY